MTPFAIAGIQMHIAALHTNIEAMSHRLDLLMHLYPWVQMVMFSELAPFGPAHENAQKLPGWAEEAFQEMARRHRIWLLPGSMFELCDGAIYNTASVIRPYEAGVEAGDEFLVFDVDGVGRFGVSICYDMWFPETTRTLVSMGAEVILHPVLTYTIDRDVELSMAHATAALFQCYVFDINGLGAGGNGRSCVVDPAGYFLHQSSVQEDLIPIEIDLDRVRRQRTHGLRGLGQTLKSFRDRRVNFTIYDRQAWDDGYLQSLGPLVKPRRGDGLSLGLPAGRTLSAQDEEP